MEDAITLPIGGQVWRATEEQKISTQVCRIPCKKININVLKERTEEDIGGVYTQEECSIYVLIEKSNKTVTGLILLEIVYNVKKKLGCIL